MLLNRLLYSRSFSKDYRWILVPDGQSPEARDDITELLRQLNEEYDVYDRSKGLDPDGEGTLLFGKSVGQFGVLCRCGPTKYEDSLGRRIFALTGLLARHEEKKEFAAALPYLVALGGESLEVPVDLGEAVADQIRNEVATERVALEELRAKLPATAREWLSMPHVQWKASQDLRSADDGLQYLLRLLGSPLIPWMDFAFAAPAQLARKIGTFDVVVGDVGLAVRGVGEGDRKPEKLRVHAASGPGRGGRSAGGQKRKPRRDEQAEPQRARAGRGTVGSTQQSGPAKASPVSTRGDGGRQRRPATPILPDRVDGGPPTDDDDTVRIRAVADSSYLDKVLDRAYFRFEAYESGGYVAGQSERFLLSRNVKRDHVAQRNALHGLVEELCGRGYERLEGTDADWSEIALRPMGGRKEQKERD